MPVLARTSATEGDDAAGRRMPNGVAQHVFQRLGQGVEVTAHPAGGIDLAAQLGGRPATFIAGVFGEHFPQGLDLDRFIGQSRAFGVEPSQLQRVFHQPLHAIDFAANTLAQGFQPLFAFAGHPQATQRRAQFVGQVAQQLLLQRHGSLQAFGHVIERPAQFTQFIRAIGGPARQPNVQLIGAPGIGLCAKVIERHHQQAVQPDAQQQGEQSRNHAVGDHAPEHPVLPGHEALGQFDHQAAGGGIAGKRHTHPRPTFLVDRPIEAAQKGQVLDVLVGQRLAAQGLQITADDTHPALFAALHALQPAVDALTLVLTPRLLGFGGVARQGAPGLVREELVALLHIAAPGPTEPDHQQTERHQQTGEFPEQRVPPRQITFHRRHSGYNPCPRPCALHARYNRWP
ncbi:hypothetical protein D3C87_1328130 [compost metagenome]